MKRAATEAAEERRVKADEVEEEMAVEVVDDDDEIEVRAVV